MQDSMWNLPSPTKTTDPPDYSSPICSGKPSMTGLVQPSTSPEALGRSIGIVISVKPFSVVIKCLSLTNVVLNYTMPSRKILSSGLKLKATDSSKCLISIPISTNTYSTLLIVMFGIGTRQLCPQCTMKSQLSFEEARSSMQQAPYVTSPSMRHSTGSAFYSTGKAFSVQNSVIMSAINVECSKRPSGN